MIDDLVIKNYTPKVLVHTAESPDSQRRKLRDCNNYFIKFDVVISSPSIQYGLDFNPEVYIPGFKGGHFDYIFGFYKGMSIGTDQVSQALNRVRNTKVPVYLVFDKCVSKGIMYDQQTKIEVVEAIADGDAPSLRQIEGKVVFDEKKFEQEYSLYIKRKRGAYSSSKSPTITPGEVKELVKTVNLDGVQEIDRTDPFTLAFCSTMFSIQKSRFNFYGRLLGKLGLHRRQNTQAEN